MWNDTDTPLAYLITFRTYGTWLHGDERGSTSRHRNTFGTAFLPTEESWTVTNRRRMKREPVVLDSRMRSCVEEAIKETCRFRNWVLKAMNVSTNHAHIITSIGLEDPSKALNAFKANATRAMRIAGLITGDASPWSDRGSQRHLWNEKHIADAIEYVVNGQGEDLPSFD